MLVDVDAGGAEDVGVLGEDGVDVVGVGVGTRM